MIRYFILGYLIIVIISWIFTFISIRKAPTDSELWGKEKNRTKTS